MPAEAGIQGKQTELATLDSRFRGNDKKEINLTITPSPFQKFSRNQWPMRPMRPFGSSRIARPGRGSSASTEMV